MAVYIIFCVFFDRPCIWYSHPCTHTHHTHTEHYFLFVHSLFYAQFLILFIFSIIFYSFFGWLLLLLLISDGSLCEHGCHFFVSFKFTALFDNLMHPHYNFSVSSARNARTSICYKWAKHNEKLDLNCATENSNEQNNKSELHENGILHYPFPVSFFCC